jgi:hypothetical protein
MLVVTSISQTSDAVKTIVSTLSSRKTGSPARNEAIGPAASAIPMPEIMNGSDAVTSAAQRASGISDPVGSVASSTSRRLRRARPAPNAPRNRMIRLLRPMRLRDNPAHNNSCAV